MIIIYHTLFDLLHFLFWNFSRILLLLIRFRRIFLLGYLRLIQLGALYLYLFRQIFLQLLVEGIYYFYYWDYFVDLIIRLFLYLFPFLLFRNFPSLDLSNLFYILPLFFSLFVQWCPRRIFLDLFENHFYAR